MTQKQVPRAGRHSLFAIIILIQNLPDQLGMSVSRVSQAATRYSGRGLCSDIKKGILRDKKSFNNRGMLKDAEGC